MPSTAPTLDLSEIAAQLRHGVGRLARRLRREGGGPGITAPLVSALTTIERHGTMNVGSLSTHEQVQPPTMTKIVAALVDDGLVTRTADPLDGRVAWLSVTPAGRKLLAQRRRRMDAYLVARLKALAPEDIATLERAAQIVAQLTEDPK